MSDRDNLCPECNGGGYIEGACIFMGGQYDPPEYEDVVCPACDGTGEITAVPTEEEEGGYDPWEADEYERWLDSL